MLRRKKELWKKKRWRERERERESRTHANREYFCPGGGPMSPAMSTEMTSE
jgi:hypothetical protein